MEIFSTYQSAQNQVLKADLPHNRPFPRHWYNKKSYLYFSQKSDSNQNLDFNPVPPHLSQPWVLCRAESCMKKYKGKKKPFTACDGKMDESYMGSLNDGQLYVMATQLIPTATGSTVYSVN